MLMVFVWGDFFCLFFWLPPLLFFCPTGGKKIRKITLVKANGSYLQIPFACLSLILNGAAEVGKLDVAYLRASPAIGNVCGLCEFSRPPFKYE